MKKTQKQASVTIKAVKKIFHMKLNSQENIENNEIERGKDVTLQNQEISPEKNFTPSSTEKHISHDTKANKSKYREIRNP